MFDDIDTNRDLRIDMKELSDAINTKVMAELQKTGM